MKNKILSILVGTALLMSVCSCSKKSVSGQKPLNVVATIFPVWDWTRNIVENTENLKLDLLVKNGVDLHSFQPSAADIIKMSGCDVLIYVGGESDAWVNDVIEGAVNKNMKVVNLMELLSDSVKEEEIVEGMEGEESEEGEDEEEIEYDEHVWLSVENAEKCAEGIALAISEKSEENKDKIFENYSKYIKQLEDLKNSFVPENETVIVCDRFPFRYMTDELGLKYYAAFAGCSAETEASFETVAFLSKKVKELGQSTVYVTESSDKKMALTVLKNAGVSAAEENIVVLDSLQSTTLEQAKKGKTYISAMKENFQKVGK